MPEPYRIDVAVEAKFVPEQSQPDARKFAFAYTITIRNTGAVAAQLLSRHWLITDGDGQVQEVRGDGVVGEQPRLEPGQGFRYTSGAMIETPVGAMRGEYRMRSDDGFEFEAPIPPFTLAVPNVLQ